MMDGYPKDWVETDNRLAEIPAERFMAGHGPVGEHAAILEAREFIHTMMGGVEDAIADGQDEATAAKTVTEGMRERFGGWRGFERVEDSVAYAYRKISV
jgi:hypothetical protein